MTHFYHVFGLSLEAALTCPELLPAAASSAPDIVIRFGEVPESLENPADSGVRWQSAQGRYLLNLLRVARFLVTEGREIVVQPVPGVPEDTIRVFLLGTCLSILLHQRKLYALHCNCHKGTHEAIFQEALGRPYKAHIIESVRRDGELCHFAIDLA